MKGYVYLFRQKGTQFIKIGMTQTESVKDRYGSFCTYAPNGGEIVHIIETENATKLEKELHIMFKKKRLNGEFFLLNDEDIENVKNIENYRIKLLSDFFWNYVINNKNLDSESLHSIIKFKDRHISSNSHNILQNVKEKFNGLEITNNEILNYINSLGNDITSKNLGQILSLKYKSKSKWIDGKTQRIYLIN